jgi:hypothetical protein
MQPILDHIALVVRPALRKYMLAENALTDALTSTNAGAARQDAHSGEGDQSFRRMATTCSDR